MIKLYLIIKTFYILDYQVITEVFFGTLTCLTPKKKNTYITHTQSARSKCAAANNLATYNEIAANFTHVRLLFRTRFGLCCLLLLPACLPLKISTEIVHTYMWD